MSDKNNKALKPGWRRVKFGDVVRLSKARSQDPLGDGIERYVGLEHLEPGDLRIRSWGSVADGVTFTSVFQPGQVLFGKRRAYQRKVAVADFSGVCSGDIYVLETKNAQVLLPELLPFICQTDAFFDHAVGTSAGSLSPRTNWTSLADFEFVLPPSNEQSRLVTTLVAQTDVIEAKQEVRIALEKCLKSTRAQILSEGLLGKIDETTGLPVGWSREPLGNLVEFLDHKRVPIKEADRSKRRGQYPYYGASGVIDSIDDYLFDEDLILVGEDGANVLDRSSPLAFKVSGKIWVNNHAHVLRVLAPNDIDYLADYLESITYKPYVTGTAQPKLNKAALNSVPVPVPPGEEQLQIAAVYAQFLEGKDMLARELKSLRDLYRLTLAGVGEANV
ncbi:restriction endonuclease subunit S [Stutzerimonas nitrititolerans]|uniref:restriction endonuclease subunit S n=1 Tax=Stutzerimonas nitrititolerans TaxID=2482751 RepID=UPI001BD23BBB